MGCLNHGLKVMSKTHELAQRREATRRSQASALPSGPDRDRTSRISLTAMAMGRKLAARAGSWRRTKKRTSDRVDWPKNEKRWLFCLSAPRGLEFQADWGVKLSQ